MYKIILNLENDRLVTLYFTNNLTVYESVNINSKEPEVRVMDGLHTNCGWIVKNSYEEVIKKIDAAIAGDKND